MKFRLNSMTVQLYVNLPKIYAVIRNCFNFILFMYIYENLQVLMT